MNSWPINFYKGLIMVLSAGLAWPGQAGEAYLIAPAPPLFTSSQ